MDFGKAATAAWALATLAAPRGRVLRLAAAARRAAPRMKAVDLATVAWACAAVQPTF